MRYFWAWLIAVVDVGLIGLLGDVALDWALDAPFGLVCWMMFAVGVLVPLLVGGFLFIMHLLGGI
jgi:hypothetical protein